MTEYGWIGVDLDATLAEYRTGDGIATIGKPIWPMVQRVLDLLAEGKDVRIMTARVAVCGRTNPDGVADDEDFASQQRCMIEAWCKRYIGQVLPITCTKDFQMIALYDDRAIRIQANVGEPCCGHHLLPST